MQQLDSILSGKGEATPAPETTDTAPATEAVETTAAPELEEGAESATGEAEVGKTVPLAALQAERSKAKRYTEQVAEFDKRIAEQNARIDRLLGELVSRQPQPQQKPQEPPPDWYADPEKALSYHLTPIQQQMQRMAMDSVRAASETRAIARYGYEAFAEMETAVNAGIQSGDPEIEKLRYAVMNSHDPAGVAMQWYQQRKLMAEVGPDPAAYREKVKQEVLAELQAGGQAAKPAAPVMPSNLAGARNVGSRSGPAWSGPMPIADIFNMKRPA